MDQKDSALAHQNHKLYLLLALIPDNFIASNQNHKFFITNYTFSGQQMCALCPSDAQRENLGGRCKGHGVEERTTKWRSTFKPKCRGKWRRVREMSECPCLNGPDYVFV